MGCLLLFYDFNIIGFVLILCIRSEVIKKCIHQFAFLYLINRRTQCLSTLMPKLTKQGNKKETEACTYMNAWACIMYYNAHILFQSLSLFLATPPHTYSLSLPLSLNHLTSQLSWLDGVFQGHRQLGTGSSEWWRECAGHVQLEARGKAWQSDHTLWCSRVSLLLCGRSHRYDWE